MRTRHFLFSLALPMLILSYLAPSLPVAAQSMDQFMARVTGKTIHVPGDFTSIQAAIDAAADGDLVLLAPGTYNEPVELAEKSVTLASELLTTGNQDRIAATVLDGTKPGGAKGRNSHVIRVRPSAGENTQIVGFTIQGGDDGITCGGNVHIVHNRFFDNVDAIDYESGGGYCAYNLFEENEDDAIDLDGPCEGLFEHNIIRNNEDDGVEIRLQPYSGPLMRAVFRHNLIQGNEEDGIQIIDYFEPADREIVIERNFILDTAMAGIGFMGGTKTGENYMGADVDERVFILNNTLSGNMYGISGGNCVIALNNIIVNTEKTALHRVDYNSVVEHVLLWDNGLDIESSNVNEATVIRQDPKFGTEFNLSPGSPCIDAGIVRYSAERREAFEFPKESYAGSAPDLGAAEAE